ncbi:MAG: hypothetical protein F6K41_17830 [Symploca sp. SIO3E6]|nr:hypothetical protein [Caldora sp. SIO3E6]
MEVVFTTKAQSTRREDAIAITNIIPRQLVDKEIGDFEVKTVPHKYEKRYINATVSVSIYLNLKHLKFN